MQLVFLNLFAYFPPTKQKVFCSCAYIIVIDDHNHIQYMAVYNQTYNQYRITSFNQANIESQSQPIRSNYHNHIQYMAIHNHLISNLQVRSNYHNHIQYMAVHLINPISNLQVRLIRSNYHNHIQYMAIHNQI
jgi:hypothetical protein